MRQVLGPDDLPNSGRIQRCDLCGGPAVSWVHPLDRHKVEYREYGKGHTLPTFWITCQDCEQLLDAGRDKELIERMKSSGGFRPEIEEWSQADVDEVLRKPLAVFRTADLGRFALPNSH